MFMKTLLWIQSKNNSEKNILSCNGERIAEEDSRYQKLFDVLASPQHKPAIENGNFSFYQKHLRKQTEYIIYSNFNELDDINRQVAYMAGIVADSFDEAEKALENEAKLYGYTCRNTDIECIKKYLAKPKIAKILSVIGLILFIILLIKK